ncbi:MAG: hypothetical protein ACOC2C_01465 [Cyclonatronaceae bacterium]
MSPRTLSQNSDPARIRRLMAAYFEGETSLDEERELRRYFAQPAEALPEDLRPPRAYFQFFEQTEAAPAPSFDAMIEQLPAGPAPEAAKGRHVPLWLLRAAAGIILLLCGFIAGMMAERLSGPEAHETQLQEMRAEVQELRRTLISGAFQNASANDRIRAVQASAALGDRDSYDAGLITQILAYTLNTDPNVHVRAAAADALYSLAGQPMVPETLMQSLSPAQDEMIQLKLVEMLTELNTTAAADKMRRLLVHPETSPLLERRLRLSIALLEERQG